MSDTPAYTINHLPYVRSYAQRMSNGETVCILDELNRIAAELSASQASGERMRKAIQKAIDDDETGKWGPDITVKADLIAALEQA